MELEIALARLFCIKTTTIFNQEVKAGALVEARLARTDQDDYLFRVYIQPIYPCLIDNLWKLATEWAIDHDLGYEIVSHLLLFSTKGYFENKNTALAISVSTRFSRRSIR